MPRPAVVIALPPSEAEPVAAQLREGGYDAIGIEQPDELERLLGARRDIGLAIIDAESDHASELYGLVREVARDLPSLLVVSESTLERITVEGAPDGRDDEFVTRPYSPESLRWRVEAMLIRSQTVDDGSGEVLQLGPIDTENWSRRASLILSFNPKGGTGKTTVAVNLAAALQVRFGQRVLLVDADTVTGHVASSLGLQRVTTAAQAWSDEPGPAADSLVSIATTHSTGMQVVVLTLSPLHAESLDPYRVTAAISRSRRGFDFVVVDMHPDYGELNRALFDSADRILVPVTPDVPAIRAAVQFREVATELGIGERVGMIVNRANSGVSVKDMEETIGVPSFAQIRSSGMCLVRAANEGCTLVERFPREKITDDFVELGKRIVSPQRAPAAARPSMRIFGRQREQAVRA